MSTRKSYVCAVKHLILHVVPNPDDNCKILETEIADLIFRNNRITRNKKNSQIKSNSIEHHRFIIQELKKEFYCIYLTLKKDIYNKQSELGAISGSSHFWDQLDPVKYASPAP